MKLDDKIKASLNAEQLQLDKVISTDDGLFERITGVYQGSMRWWVMLSSLIALFLTAGFIYAGFQFYIADNVSEQVFWAVWFVVGLMMQVAIKLWIFMEMNRVAQLKELKRTELVILQAIKRIT
jgi:hypothetical protein